MSSNSNSASSSPPRVPRHIRLNSGHEDLLSNDASNQPTDLISQRAPVSQRQVYQSQVSRPSSEHLLPPSRSRSMRSPGASPARSAHSSRRSSFDSLRSTESRGFEKPFRDSSQSRAPSEAGSEDEGLNTQTVSDKYNILPSAELLLFQ